MTSLMDEIALPPVAASVASARRFVAAGFAGCSCPDLTIDAALLLVSELATNAVMHAATGFTVTFVHDEDVVTIEVSDSDPSLPVRRDPDVSDGRGLHIVDKLAAEWGVRGEANGKAVYFRLPC